MTGSNYMVYFRAKLGQAKFPAGSTGTIHTWGYWFAGPVLPEDPTDVTLTDKAAGEKPSDEAAADSGDGAA